MSTPRVTAVFLVALGMAGVAIALGFLYKDSVRREGAWADLQSRIGRVSEEERRAVLKAWEGPDHFMPALVSGTAGATALGAGLLIAVFELPMMGRRGAR
jgi:hypothetical protein